MGHRDDDIAFLVSLIDIAVRLDDLFQRVASVDDWSDRARLNQPCDEDEFFKLFTT
jgi:hypothetical protein